MSYTEQEIAAVLNAYMYLNRQDIADGTSLEGVVKALEGANLNASESRSYEIIKAACDNGMGGFRVDNQSCHMDGFANNCTNAATFKDPSTGNNYVVYRGTAGPEWGDNGVGMYTAGGTPQQQNAADYFDRVAETNGWTESDNIIVTGHSKGGNKAQYTTMSAEHNNLIDTCYSLDGQGFSPEQIQEWKDMYGDDYQNYVDKMYGINGENDFVNPLGETLIPSDHITYVATPTASDFAGYHDVTYMFNDLSNPSLVYTDSRGAFGDYANTISELLMKLPPEVRDGVADTIMSLCGGLLGNGNWQGINGEAADIFDIIEFHHIGLPIVVMALLTDGNGIKLLKEFLEGLSPAQILALIGGLLFIAPFLGGIIKFVGFGLLAIELIADAIEVIALAIELVKEIIKIVGEVVNAFMEFINGLLNAIADFFSGVVDFFSNLFGSGKKDNSGDGFCVSTGVLYGASSDYSYVANELWAIKGELNEIRNNMAYAVKSSVDISSNLRVCSRLAEACAIKIASMGSITNECANYYEASEKRLLSNVQDAIVKINSLDFNA